MSEDRLRSIFLEGQPNWLEQPTLRGASVRDVLDLLDTQTFFKLLTLPYPTRSGGVIEKLIGMRLIEGGRDDVMRHDLLP